MWKSLPFLHHLSLLAAILPLFILMSSWRPCGAKPKGDVCVLNGQQYRVGQTFHPKVLPVENKCVNCTCLKDGQVRCASAKCEKPDCEDPKYVAGECCPVCEVEVEVDQPELSTPPGCDYDGEHYEEGEEFPSNKTAYTPLHDQCVLCQCFRSQVFCHLKTCIPTPNCLKTVTVADDCCQQCAEYEVDPAQSSKEGRLKPGDCLSSTMGPQKNGTTWKPVVGQYGAMECVVCQCQDGRVQCNRVQCPSPSAHKCRRPQIRKGKCCRECPRKNRTERKVHANDDDNDSDKDSKGKKTEEGKKKKCKKEKGGNKKRRKGKKKKKRCKKNNKKVSEKQVNASTKESTRNVGVLTMDTARDKLCINKKADYLVYVIKGDNSHSLVLDDLRSNGTWEKMDWTIRKGLIISSKKSSLSKSSSLRRKITTKHIIGTAFKRNAKKFFKKLEKKLEKCKKKCRRKILDKTMKRLKVKSVNLKKYC